MPITIYGELYSLKNSKQIIMVKGRPMLIPSKAYNASVKPIEQQLVLNRYRWVKEIENASKPLKIVFKIYRKTQRICDWQNLGFTFNRKCDIIYVWIGSAIRKAIALLPATNYFKAFIERRINDRTNRNKIWACSCFI